MIRLEPITAANWREVSQVRVSDGQLPLVAGYEPVSFVIMAKAYLRVAGFEWHPLAVYEGSTPVGVLAMVDEGSRFALYHLVIDGPQQGRGLGRAAVLAAIEWAGRPVRLTVNADNAAARALYESLGFEYGEGMHGELGMYFPRNVEA